MHETYTRSNGRSLGELFGDLSRDASTLIRQEVRLAGAEMSQKASRAGKDIGYLAAGAAVGYAGFLVLLGALVAGLAEFIPVWLSALVVGLVVAVVGYVLVQKGLSELRKMDLMPRQTIETLREDVQWTKEQVT